MANAENEWKLAAADVSGLLATIADSLQVRRRHQFFNWTQGRLQELIPHGVLVCGVPRASGPRMFFDYFYNVPIAAATLARLCHPRLGIASEMIEVWLAEGGNPTAFSVSGTTAGPGRIAVELEALGLGSALAHGIPSPQAGCGAYCFFSFVALSRVPQPRDADLVQALVPHLFGSYCRALLKDRPPASMADASYSDAIITEREVEIMRWVREGKSNQEIGMILSISPLTVKNHVQKILRKLQANNRAQAVSKAIALKLLGSPSAPHERDAMTAAG